MSVNSWPQAPSRTAKKPKYQVKYLIGVVLIFGVIGYLIFFGISSTQQYYLTPSELFNKGQTVIGQGNRVGGNLVPDSIQQDIKNNKINFAITDGARKLPVSYNGVVPDTFPKATQVIVEGKLGMDGTFVASDVLAKCPSKYDSSQIETFDTKSGGNLNYGGQ
ncbi:MAG: cytochrome c maturation protein CcmE [Anaerolineae bacterium]